MTQDDPILPRFGGLTASLEQAGETLSLLSPFTARLPASLADLACSLPIGDANGELLESIRGDAPFPPQTFAGVLANDPFRLAEDLLAMLSRRGCRGIANWPSAALLGGTLGKALGHSGLGYEEEMAFLTQAARQGFRTLAVIAREEQLPLALATAPTQLLVAAELETIEDSNTGSAGLLSLIEKIREAGYVPWLYEHEEVQAITASLYPWVEAVIRHPGPGRG